MLLSKVVYRKHYYLPFLTTQCKIWSKMWWWVGVYSSFYCDKSLYLNYNYTSQEPFCHCRRRRFRLTHIIFCVNFTEIAHDVNWNLEKTYTVCIKRFPWCWYLNNNTILEFFIICGWGLTIVFNDLRCLWQVDYRNSKKYLPNNVCRFNHSKWLFQQIHLCAYYIFLKVKTLKWLHTSNQKIYLIEI